MSKIEWTGINWNPTTGCDKISAGCKNCYAETMSHRLKAMGQQKYKDGFQFRMHEYALNLPYTWKKPQTVFVNSMSDLFHEDCEPDFIKKVFAVMNDTPQHTYQVLTKRADRLFLVHGFLNWTPNIWMGVSVEDHRVMDRVIYLRQTNAAVKFLSCEPLIGPLHNLDLTGIDWVITGGESGHKARPVHPDWIRSLRDQCKAASVAFFFKQWGAYYTKWSEAGTNRHIFKMYQSYLQFTHKLWVHKGDKCVDMAGKDCNIGGDFMNAAYPVAIMNKVGKHNAGRLLDGVEHNEMPAAYTHNSPLTTAKTDCYTTVTAPKALPPPKKQQK